MIQHPRKWLCLQPTRAITIVMALVLVAVSPVLVQADISKIPHLGKKAIEQYQQYQFSAGHKAFAIAPGGAWYWLTEIESEAQAEQQVLEGCQKHTQQKCVLYALNNRIVFDSDNWPSLWGPYADAATASKAKTGTSVGQRFPDISWLDASGKRHSVSSEKGKVVFLHFWGSWCPPCMREFPSLKKLYENIQRLYADDVSMKLLQLREPFTDSMLWAEKYNYADMPLFDSGIEDSESEVLLLKGGGHVADRYIARVFPSTYVLDRHGLVIFSHRGPVHDWLEYLAFFDHVVNNTGKSGGTTENSESSKDGKPAVSENQ